MRRVEELSQDQPPWQVQERLRREADAELCRAATALVEARQNAVAKFGPLAAQMYFDNEGVQMASGGPVAAHRAARFATGTVRADLTCGLGGDTLALAQHGPVLAADTSAARLWMAARNAAVVDPPHPVQVVRADAQACIVPGVPAVADPARRDTGGRRVRNERDYTPSLSQLLTQRTTGTCWAIKVSPALDETQFPTDVDEVEYVSWNGQCREAVLWFDLADAARRRVSLVGGPQLSWDGDRPPHADVGPPQAYLYDPDPALVRSHLVGLLADQLQATLLGEQVAYLSSSVAHDTPWARRFRVLEQVPFGVRRVRETLHSHGWRATEILRRRFPVEPQTLARDLRRGGDDGTPVSLLCTRVDERPVVFICDPH